VSEWLHHLWHDPLRHNPWSLAVLLVIVAAAVTGMMFVETMMFRRRRKETTMAEANSPEPIKDEPGWTRSFEDKAQADETIAGARSTGSRVATWTPEMDGAADQRDPEATLVQERRWREEGLPEGDGPPLQPLHRPPYPSKLAARAAVPHAMVNQHREQCEHCGGTGYMPAISDYLRESISLLGDQGDEVVRTFYGVLLRSAPDLVSLFPGNPTEGDLGTDHRGAKQRERLLGALIALSDLYDPDDDAKMERLDTALASFGRSHAAFVRPDGTIMGATIEEYAAVKTALFSTLVKAAGNAWKPEYTAAWSQAYDYASGVMLAEQYRSGFSSPRFPRA
jgi:hemoglobin-like flavoprotein